MSSAGVSFRALIGRIGIALVVCVAVIAAGVTWVNRYIDDELERIPRVALATSTTENHGMNYLIIGSDSRDFVDNGIDQQAFGTPTDAGPPKSDTVMVLHANGDQSYAVSFPRDTWVRLPNGSEAKINAAFNDGAQAVVDTLQQNFDLNINHYLEVDFVTFEGLVNAIGGVPLWVDNPIKDDLTGLDLIFGNACWQLDGRRALAYVRSRHMEEYYDGAWHDKSGLADLDRITRQQEFIKTLGRVAMQRALDDPGIAPDLADQVLPNLTADEGFDRAAFNQLARSLMGLRGGEAGIEFATLPTERAFRGGGQDVQIPIASEAAPMLERLRGNVVVDAAPDATSTTDGDAATRAVLRPSDVRVTVLNGSGVTGAAGAASNDIGNEGFVRGTVGNDPRGSVQRTEVQYRPADLAKAQLVASYVAGAELVPNNALTGDIVLVLGKNFTEIGRVAPAGDAAETPVTTLSPEAACTA